MPTLNFNLLGIPVAVEAGFFWIVPLTLWPFHWSLELAICWVAILVGSVLLHELGHALVCVHFGRRPMIRLWAMGGVTFDFELPPRKAILMSLAGPGVGIVLGTAAALVLVAVPESRDWIPVWDLAVVNLAWGLLSLLPEPGLDGERIVTSLTAIGLGSPARTAGRLAGAAVEATLCCVLWVIGFQFLAMALAIGAFFSFVRVGKVSTLLGSPSQVKTPYQLADDGRNEEALAASDRVLARAPGNADVLEERAWILLRMSRFEEALVVFNEAIRLAPDSPALRAGRHSVYKALGMDREAEEDRTMVMRREPSDWRVCTAQALLSIGEDRWPEAARACHSGLSLPDVPDPIITRLKHLIIVIDLETGHLERALRSAEAELVEWPGDAGLHETRAFALMGLGRSAEALGAARRAQSAHPRNPALLKAVGVAARMAGDAAGGLTHLLASAVARPRSPGAVGELAACFVQLGRLEEAERGLDNLPRWSLRESSVLYARGCLLAAKGRMREGAEDIVASAQISRVRGCFAAVDPVLVGLRSDPEAAAILRPWLAPLSDVPEDQPTETASDAQAQS
jgi:Flp pilus assembly protein TadD/Zn-dependent protease